MVTMTGDEENKNKTVSFRVSEDIHGDLSELDRGISEFYRGLTDMYFEDPFFREGVEAVLDGEFASFENYSMSQLQYHAEVFAEQIVDEYNRPVDAAELKEPLMSYALNVAARYRTGTDNALEQVRNVDEPIGDGLKVATERFPDQYWDNALE